MAALGDTDQDPTLITTAPVIPVPRQLLHKEGDFGLEWLQVVYCRGYSDLAAMVTVTVVDMATEGTWVDTEWDTIVLLEEVVEVFALVVVEVEVLEALVEAAVHQVLAGPGEDNITGTVRGHRNELLYYFMEIRIHSKLLHLHESGRAGQ